MSKKQEIQKHLIYNISFTRYIETEFKKDLYLLESSTFTKGRLIRPAR